MVIEQCPPVPEAACEDWPTRHVDFSDARSPATHARGDARR